MFNLKTISTVSLIVLTCAAGSVHTYAAEADELSRSEAAYAAAWEQAPLKVRQAIFVTERPDGYGMYSQRPDNVFKQGEKLVTYAEPVGYGFKDIGNGNVEFGFQVGFVIKKPTGEILGGNENFARLTKTSHVRNREFMLTLTLDISDAPAGDYVLVYKLQDITGNKSTSFELPFRIAG
jgi:hypothetical protein